MAMTEAVHAVRRRLLQVSVVVGVAALIGGCGGSSDDDKGSSQADSGAAASGPATSMSVEQLRSELEGKELKIGSAAFPNPSLVGLYKVVELLREDFGMEPELQLLDSAPLTAALLSGDVQLAHVSLSGLAAAADAGGELTAVAGDDQKNVFLVTAKAPIRTMEELDGKKFAISQSATSIVGQTGAKCFEDAGMEMQKDTQLLQLDNVGSIVEALMSGAVDGGVSATFRQVELDATDPGEFNVLCKGWEADPQLNDVMVLNDDYLKDNQALAQAVAIAELRAARWMQEDQAGWEALAQRELDGLTPEQASANYDTLVRELDDWPVNGSLDRRMCDYTLAEGKASGALRTETSCDDLVTFEYQDAAVRLLGPSRR
ncbi:ABC transporter substrate-binding protein [Conexibacter woesei]|uniref:Substrate-binding region of ABC-type glycine betaine transport system n=1 Tax=Conexibacter woesei (strain DSM 14684 / CCUG 47730 / CIP 108061 / JCM 11494 / NBRC 100937 / ID131577) TaxID=469383 RepID=D3F7J2_CONWI|nr:PhnD/SsuA/transferrin family substrate-binding protein [Conexibacter woesei]ADB50854.1 Substrate-binding region of ABC-type glycine betaine transport system [Conexibacter woesei DSM 14684]